MHNTPIIVKPIAIEASDLTFRYDREVVLERMSFSIRHGEYVGILGPNGGGKTTLIKLILGLLEPEKGSVTLFDQHGQELRNRASIAYVPQRSARTDISFPATVFELVRSGRTPHHHLLSPFLRESDTNAIRWALHQTGITKLARRRITTLSGGQLQRVFLARALAAKPTLLVLDEPDAGVDQVTQTAFYELLGELNKKHGLTILLVSHDVEVVTRHVNHLLCVHKTLVCHGAPQTLLREHFVEKLYGDKKAHVEHTH